MAYYTGGINSYADLQAAIHDACIANGWSLSNGILSKGTAFIQLTVLSTTVPAGIRMGGGTGATAGALTGSTPISPRLGPPTTGAWGQSSWPATFHIHVHTNPDEVFVVLNFNLTDFYWLAFGVSTLPLQGSGLWMAGSSGKRNMGGYGSYISASEGLCSAYWACPLPFWQSGSDGDEYTNAVVQTGSSSQWSTSTSTGELMGVKPQMPLIARSQTVWNAESVLLPIKSYQRGVSGKIEPVLEMAHARLCRLGSLNAGEVIQLGSDRWKVYPFYKKDTSEPNGSQRTGYAHSGTLGWAIRYDGA